MNSVITSTISIAFLALIFSPLSSVHGNNVFQPGGPVAIGEKHSIRISSNVSESSIPPTSKDDNELVYLIHHKDASFITAHISEMILSNNCIVILSDEIDDEFEVMSGRGRKNMTTFWSRHVVGDTMRIMVQCEGRIGDNTFIIDHYVAGFPDKTVEEHGEWYERRNLRSSRSLLDTKNPFDNGRGLSICQNDDRQNAACFKQTYPTEYGKSRAVARLLINGMGACTGFLVGPNNLLLTNNHCIGSLEDALNTDFEFMAEEDSCENTSGNCRFCSPGRIFDAKAILVASESEDFVLIQLDGNPSDLYGYLELEKRNAVVGEEIYIPQHPRARPKEIAMEDSRRPGSAGICKVKSISDGACSSYEYHDVRYRCDTEGGSSGSPVLARSTHKVIALHHCGGGCNGNRGVPVAQFYDAIAPFISHPCTSENEFKLELRTDNNGQETSWAIVDNRSRVIRSGNGYFGNHLYQIYECLPSGDFTFVINDSRRNGICCDSGIGSYNVYYNEQLVGSGGSFGRREAFNFGSSMVLSPTPNSPNNDPVPPPDNDQVLSPDNGPVSSPDNGSPLSPYPSDCNGNVFKLTLRAETNAQSISWDIRAAGQDTRVTASGSGYSDKQVYELHECLQSGIEFVFMIYSSDGMATGVAYEVEFDGNQIGAGGSHNGGTFHNSESLRFGSEYKEPPLLPDDRWVQDPNDSFDTCSDDPNWQKTVRSETITCSFFLTSRRSRLCHAKGDDGRPASEACPRACELCR